MPTSFGSDDDGGADVVFFIWHFQFDKLRELSPHNREPLARATYQNTHTKCTAFILVHNKFNELNQIGNVALRETKKMRTKKSRTKKSNLRLHVYSCSCFCLSSFAHEEIDSLRNINLIYLIGRTLFISSSKFICNPHSIARGSVCRLCRWYFLRVHFPLSISSFSPWLFIRLPIVSNAFAYCFFIRFHGSICNHVDEALCRILQFYAARSKQKKLCSRFHSRRLIIRLEEFANMKSSSPLSNCSSHCGRQKSKSGFDGAFGGPHEN